MQFAIFAVAAFIMGVTLKTVSLVVTANQFATHLYIAVIRMLVDSDFGKRTPQRTVFVVAHGIMDVDDKIRIAADGFSIGVIAVSSVLVNFQGFRRTDRNHFLHRRHLCIAGVGMRVLRKLAFSFHCNGRQNQCVDCAKRLFVNLYHQEPLDPKELLNTLHEYRDMVAPYVGNVSEFLYQALKEGKNILLEGQLGTMKDPDHGIYPMVTSSSTLAAYGAIGAGIPPYEIKKIIAVTKAYSSAVGAGAFVSEIFGDEADELRRRGGDGGEFGATTGRPRRMGWYDCVASHYGCRLQGATDVALTVLDVLGYLDEIPVCVGYEIDGQVTKEFPVTCKLEKAKPVYEVLPGWKCDIRGIRTYEELPENCRKYIEFIENQIGYPITMVSNGPGRDDIIYRNSPLA